MLIICVFNLTILATKMLAKSLDTTGLVKCGNIVSAPRTVYCAVRLTIKHFNDLVLLPFPT